MTRRALAVAVAAILGAALAMAVIISVGAAWLVARHSPARPAYSPAQQGYASCVISGGSPSGGPPHVTVTNTGSTVLDVVGLPVAVFNSAGQQVASAYVSPPGGWAEIAPGQSLTFSDDQGQWAPSWASCRVLGGAS